jgi:hypothetical protein
MADNSPFFASPPPPRRPPGLNPPERTRATIAGTVFGTLDHLVSTAHESSAGIGVMRPFPQRPPGASWTASSGAK